MLCYSRLGQVRLSPPPGLINHGPQSEEACFLLFTQFPYGLFVVGLIMVSYFGLTGRFQLTSDGRERALLLTTNRALKDMTN